PHLGHGSRLDHPHLLKDGARCRVIRCRWTAPGQPVRSVILKRVKEDVEALTFIAEWASLVFLTALPAARQIAPRFLAGDISGRFFAMEDLGDGRTLDDVLRAPDR